MVAIPLNDNFIIWVHLFFSIEIDMKHFSKFRRLEIFIIKLMLMLQVVLLSIRRASLVVLDFSPNPIRHS